MADEKLKSAPAPAPVQRDLFIEIFGLFLLLIIVSTLFIRVGSFLRSNSMFSLGWKSLTPHALTLANTRSISSLANPINAHIVASADTLRVFGDAGGVQTGTHTFGAKGSILRGPVRVGGVNYYYVDFDSGTDGWVAENDMVYSDGTQSPVVSTLLYVWHVATYIGYVLAFIGLLLLAFVIRIFLKLKALRMANKQKLYPVIEPVQTTKHVNPKWERIQEHMRAGNENDWRLAIIEADILLSDLLDTMHLVGDSIGEKLQSVSKGDFTTLDMAWEAHKVRNQIAHAGGDYHLGEREAVRVIKLFEEVFREFDFI